MPAADLTPSQRLAELVLGESLEDFVRERRPGSSWRRIAQALHEATNGDIDLAPETLRLWFPDKQREATA